MEVSRQLHGSGSMHVRTQVNAVKGLERVVRVVMHGSFQQKCRTSIRCHCSNPVRHTTRSQCIKLAHGPSQRSSSAECVCLTVFERVRLCLTSLE